MSACRAHAEAGGVTTPPTPLGPAVPVRPSFDGHGGDRCRLLLPGPLPDQFGQPRDLAEPAHPVAQVVPEVHPQLAARLLQAGERIPAAPPRRAARAAADLALLDELADIRLL